MSTVGSEREVVQEMTEQSQRVDAENPHQLAVIDTDPSTSATHTRELADMHGLIVEMRDVLSSFLQEFKTMNERQLSKEERLRQSDKGKGADRLSSISSQAASGRSDEDKKMTTFAERIDGYTQDLTCNDIEADMKELYELFLNGPEARPDDALRLPGKISSSKGSDLSSLEVHGAVLTIKYGVRHRSKNHSHESISPKRVWFLSQEPQMISVRDFLEVVKQEWESMFPWQPPQKTGYTTWNLGGKCFAATELLHGHITYGGRPTEKDSQIGPRRADDRNLREFYDKPIKVWKLFFYSKPIYLVEVPTIYALLARRFRPGPDPSFHSVVNKFFWNFCGTWKGSEYRGDSYDGFRDGSQGTCPLQYHLRMFAVMEIEDKRYYSGYEGLSLCRLRGDFPSLGGVSIGCFQEQRVSLTCYVNGERNDPHISPEVKLIALADIPPFDVPDPDEREAPVVRGWLWGYYLFQRYVWQIHRNWEEGWNKCLDKIDQCVELKTEDILNPDVIDDLMFDDSFKRSKLYFATLQLLRIFNDLIRETGRDLIDNHSYRIFGEKYFDEMRRSWGNEALKDIDALKTNWKLVLSLQSEAEKRLLDRLNAKTAEIGSLRDGLFNATSVREASKSTSMNRAVVVFTIVTITYLPASFIATIFGTQLFNAPEVAGTINKFKITTVVVSISTFIVAIILVLMADKVPRMKRKLRRLKARTREHLKPEDESETDNQIYPFRKRIRSTVNRFRRMMRRKRYPNEGQDEW